MEFLMKSLFLLTMFVAVHQRHRARSVLPRLAHQRPGHAAAHLPRHAEERPQEHVPPGKIPKSVSELSRKLP